MTEQLDLFLGKLKTQLDDWNTELKLLEAEIQQAETDERIRYEKRIKNLREKERAVKETLGQIFNARDEGWDDLKEGVGSAWSSLKSSFKEAKSEFERGLKEGMNEQGGNDKE
jgi:hypothetical protein